MNKIRFLGVIVLMCLSARAASAQDRLTYTRDIAPILLKHCAACHRPGQSAPFSLLSYEDVRPRAKSIAEVIARREMPPWKPEAGHGRFQDERRMTDAEINRIRIWITQGMLRGNPADAPAVPEWSDAWRLGAPDIIVEMPEP